jgi:S1-C subfamily serine protease
MLKKILKIKLKTLKLCFLAFALFLGASFSKRGHEMYLYEHKGKSIVYLESISGGSKATGFQVEGESGLQYIMTNRHVCDGLTKDHNQIKWENIEGKSGYVGVLYRDIQADICLLEPAEGISPLRVANKIYAREKLALVGHPGGRGLTYEEGFFVEPKMIRLRTYCYEDKFRYCYVNYSSNHLNNIAYPGNSGSPVLDFFGNVVGVLFAGSRSYVTVAYMVPLEDIQRILLKH